MVAYSGLYDTVFSDGPYALTFNRPSARRRMARLFRKRGMAVTRELLLELTGVAVGAAALATLSRVQAPTDPNDLGGQRTIESINLVNRVTSAADLTALDTKVISGLAALPTTSYPADLSGNGGGGKVGI